MLRDEEMGVGDVDKRRYFFNKKFLDDVRKARGLPEEEYWKIMSVHKEVFLNILSVGKEKHRRFMEDWEEFQEKSNAKDIESWFDFCGRIMSWVNQQANRCKVQ